MPNPKMDLVGLQLHDDLVLCAWMASFDTGTIPNGVDSFVIRRDRIHRQICWMTVVPEQGPAAWARPQRNPDGARQRPRFCR
jgi:hypothetical protein